jgi:hypothetical protein
VTKKWVPFIPVELILNLDGTSRSDWDDSKPTPVLVATDFGDSMIRYLAIRQIRRETIPGRTSASGAEYCLLLVSAKESVSHVLGTDIHNGINSQIRIAKPRMLREKYSSRMLATCMEPLPPSSFPHAVVQFKGESFEIEWHRFVRNSGTFRH